MGLRASAFAHLLGRGGAAAKAKAEEETDEDRKKREEEEAKAEDEREKEEARKAEEEEREKEEAKKKAKAEGDDASDEDDEGDADAKAIRHRERARCAAIFASPAAAKRPDMAAYFAFGTAMTRSEAVNALAAVAAGEPAPERPRGLGQRMSAVPAPVLGGGEPAKPTGAAAVAAQIVAAGKKRRGEA